MDAFGITSLRTVEHNVIFIRSSQEREINQFWFLKTLQDVKNRPYGE